MTEPLQEATCFNCGDRVGPTEQCRLIPCGHSLCFYCMIERQADHDQTGRRGLLTCRCGSVVESHAWERKQQTRKRSRDSDSPQVAYVQETFSHFFLLDHLPDGVISTVFSFCTGPELARIDLTCSSFRALTPPIWEALARVRFGLFGKTEETVGKTAYQAGSALLRPDATVCIPLPDAVSRMSPTGDILQGMVHPNGRIVVIGSNEHDEEGPTPGAEGPDMPLFMRDVTTLASVLRSTVLEGLSGASHIGVVGADYDEIVVYGSCNRYLHAQRINPTQAGRNGSVRLDMEAVDSARNIDVPYSPGELPRVLGCRSMLILARRGHFFVYVPDGEQTLKLMNVTRIDPQDDRAKARGMAWISQEMGEHAFCCCTQVGRVRAWRVELRADGSVVFHDILDFQTSYIEYFEALAVTAKYAAVSPDKSKKILVYNHDGVFVSAPVVEDLDVESHYDGDGEFKYPMCMFATGEIIVSSSPEGIALLIWDMKRGALVYQFRDAFSAEQMPFQSLHDPLPHGCDVTSILPLHKQGAACMSTLFGCQYLWGFPRNEDRYRELAAIAHSFYTDRTYRGLRG